MNDKFDTSAAGVWVNPLELRVWPDNPRINDHAVDDVIRSIQRFGFGAPIVARPNGEIIAGHTRLKAAIKMDLKQVPVRFLDLPDEEAHLLSLADNRLGEIADWDLKSLVEIIEKYDLEDAEIAGWTEDDLAHIMDGLGFGGDADDNADTGGGSDDGVSFAFGDHKGRVRFDIYKKWVERHDELKDDGDILEDIIAKMVE